MTSNNSKNSEWNAKRRCKGIKDDGSQCRSWAMNDSEYCFFHRPEPEYIRKRTEAGKKGGSRGKYSKVIFDIPPTAENAAYLVETYKALIDDLQGRGQNKADTTLYLRALDGLRSALIFQIEYGDTKQRLRELEKAVDDG